MSQRSEDGDLFSPQRHSLAEDIGGLLTGVVLAAVGLALLRSTQAVTGGTAGLALVLYYATGWNLSILLTAVSLPFFVLAIRLKGWAFTVRSLVTVVAFSALAGLQPDLLGPLAPQPWYAVLLGNLLVGVAILVLFRHGSSIGGFSILGLVAQERWGWSAGYVQMGLDLAVIIASAFVVAPEQALLSAGGAVVLNLVLTLNHKPGRYLGY